MTHLRKTRSANCLSRSCLVGLVEAERVGAAVEVREVLDRRVVDLLAAREREVREVDVVRTAGNDLPAVGRVDDLGEVGHQLAPVEVVRVARRVIVIDEAVDEADDERVRLDAALVEARVLGIGGAAVRLVGAERRGDRDVEAIDLGLRDLLASGR